MPKQKKTPLEKEQERNRVLSETNQRLMSEIDVASKFLKKAAWLFEAMVQEPAVLEAMPGKLRLAVKSWLGINPNDPLTPKTVEDAIRNRFGPQDTARMSAAGGDLASRAINRHGGR